MSTLNQAASDILGFMLLDVETVEAEAVNISMDEVMEEEVDELGEDIDK